MIILLQVNFAIFILPEYRYLLSYLSLYLETSCYLLLPV